MLLINEIILTVHAATILTVGYYMSRELSPHMSSNIPIFASSLSLWSATIMSLCRDHVDIAAMLYSPAIFATGFAIPPIEAWLRS